MTQQPKNLPRVVISGAAGRHGKQWRVALVGCHGYEIQSFLTASEAEAYDQARWTFGDLAPEKPSTEESQKAPPTPDKPRCRYNDCTDGNDVCPHDVGDKCDCAITCPRCRESLELPPLEEV